MTAPHHTTGIAPTRARARAAVLCAAVVVAAAASWVWWWLNPADVTVLPGPRDLLRQPLWAVGVVVTPAGLVATLLGGLAVSMVGARLSSLAPCATHARRAAGAPARQGKIAEKMTPLSLWTWACGVLATALALAAQATPGVWARALAGVSIALAVAPVMGRLVGARARETGRSTATAIGEVLVPLGVVPLAQTSMPAGRAAGAAVPAGALQWCAFSWTLTILCVLAGVWLRWRRRIHPLAATPPSPQGSAAHSSPARQAPIPGLPPGMPPMPPAVDAPPDTGHEYLPRSWFGPGWVVVGIGAVLAVLTLAQAPGGTQASHSPQAAAAWFVALGISGGVLAWGLGVALLSSLLWFLPTADVSGRLHLSWWRRGILLVAAALLAVVGSQNDRGAWPSVVALLPYLKDNATNGFARLSPLASLREVPADSDAVAHGGAVPDIAHGWVHWMVTIGGVWWFVLAALPAWLVGWALVGTTRHRSRIHSGLACTSVLSAVVVAATAHLVPARVVPHYHPPYLPTPPWWWSDLQIVAVGCASFVVVDCVGLWLTRRLRAVTAPPRPARATATATPAPAARAHGVAAPQAETTPAPRPGSTPWGVVLVAAVWCGVALAAPHTTGLTAWMPTGIAPAGPALLLLLAAMLSVVPVVSLLRQRRRPPGH
ncbi:hypothetical protein C1Y63_01185 [Corynebacterium sp. 13CS0277]|uniref:hypothetical protein n=1 Tax=Corynebacterium sp. 13CS0277 TaxID=2071994 RepID=UPI000D04395E|nr:hypothetical protein [Corynebacterium sp. 13CS0277]PRQ12434.1 hypothetical protein C1Y63_01185 [Corynebacterium sp. 13CS0277]